MQHSLQRNRHFYSAGYCYIDLILDSIEHCASPAVNLTHLSSVSSKILTLFIACLRFSNNCRALTNRWWSYSQVGWSSQSRKHGTLTNFVQGQAGYCPPASVRVWTITCCCRFHFPSQNWDEEVRSVWGQKTSSTQSSIQSRLKHFNLYRAGAEKQNNALNDDMSVSPGWLIVTEIRS